MYVEVWLGHRKYVLKDEFERSDFDLRLWVES